MDGTNEKIWWFKPVGSGGNYCFGLLEFVRPCRSSSNPIIIMASIELKVAADELLRARRAQIQATKQTRFP